MKLKINLENAVCVKDTRGPGSDEVYIGVFAACTHKTTSETQLFVNVTDVYKKIKPGSQIAPIFLPQKSPMWEIQFNEPADLYQFSVSIVLYEMDNGEHYKILKDGANQQNVTNEFNIKELMPCLSVTSTNPVSIVECVFAVAKQLINYFAPDDLIDRYTLIKEDILSNNGRTILVPLKGCGGEYSASVNVSIEN